MSTCFLSSASEKHIYIQNICEKRLHKVLVTAADDVKERDFVTRSRSLRVETSLESLLLHVTLAKTSGILVEIRNEASSYEGHLKYFFMVHVNLQC